MSCDCEFPSPSLRCVLALVRKARQGGSPNELLKSALCLAGGLVDRLPSACDEGDDIGDDVLELLEQLSELAEGASGDFEMADADEQIWEIILPILIPIAIDLLKAWLERRRGGN
jgi:hypothetical protein